MIDYILIFLLMLISLPKNIENDILNNFPIITYIGLKFIITSAISSLIMIFLKIKFDLEVIFK